MVAQQNGTVDVQRKNIGCIVIYIKEKKKKKGLTKPKHYCSYRALTVQKLYSDIHRREKKQVQTEE